MRRVSQSLQLKILSNYLYLKGISSLAVYIVNVVNVQLNSRNKYCQ